MLLVGLTGGIGSGKTTVAEAFAKLGVPVVDADVIAHDITRPGAQGAVALYNDKYFGPSYFTTQGELDRVRLRQAVFADQTLKSRLENHLHPLISAEIDRRIAAWQGAYGILAIPLLLETGNYRQRIDRLLVVDCSEHEQVKRVMQRSGLTETEVRAIMATQLDRSSRLSQADDVLDNSASLESLNTQVLELDRRYRQLASQFS